MSAPTEGAPPAPTDEEILRLLLHPERECNEEGVQQLLATHGGRVAALLSRRYRGMLSEDDVWGCVNEAAFKCWRLIARFDPSAGTLGGWLYNATQRVAIDTLRGLHGRPGPLTAEPADATEAEPSDVTQERVALLARAVEDLPELQRAIVRADLAAGGRADDAFLAGQRNTSVNSIRVSRSKAVENLRKWFEEYGFEIERPQPRGADPADT